MAQQTSTTRLMPAAAQEPSIPCRLCAGAADYRFTAQLIKKHDVKYYVCRECGSLQTEQPYWLDETYSSNLGDLDCGSAQRNLHNFAACLAISTIWGVRTAVDFGGGDGLLTRLLRDRHIDCYVEDKYGDPIYAQAFCNAPACPDAVFAFEVLEHFIQPQAELAALFARDPKIIFGTTGRFVDQGADWWYLSRRSGHHVFFFSSAAMKSIAKAHRYILIEQASFFLFVRAADYSAIRGLFSNLAIRGLSRRLIMALSAFVPATGIGRDAELIRKSIGADG